MTVEYVWMMDLLETLHNPSKSDRRDVKMKNEKNEIMKCMYKEKGRTLRVKKWPKYHQKSENELEKSNKNEKKENVKKKKHKA